MWIDAAFDDDALRVDSAAALLRHGDFGDLGTEAVVMLALASPVGTRERSAATIDADAHIVGHGLLGR